MRLAGLARFPTADKLAARVGLRQPGSAASADDLTRLAILSGADLAVLDAAVYRPSGRFGHHRFLGGEVHREFIDLSRRRACFACLADAPIHRADWDFALLTACSKHAMRLQDRCPRPRCRRPLTWRTRDLVRCRCGVDLRGERGPPVTVDEAEANERLLLLLDGMHPPWLPSPLAPLGSADLVRLVMVTGMFLTGWRRERRIETLVASGPDAVADVVRSGLAAVAGWPRHFHGFFEAEYARSSARRGRFGASKNLGDFYGWLVMLEPGPLKDALATAAREFMARDPVRARRMHRSRTLGGQSDGLGWADVARLLGRSVETAKRLAEAGLLPQPAVEGRGVPAVFARSDVEAPALVLRDTMTLDEASATLNVSKARLRRLVEGGILAPVHRAAEEGWGRWSFRRNEVEGLTDRLASGAAASPGAPRASVDFNHAVGVMGRRGVDFVAFIRLVGEGHLPVACVDPEAVGLKRLRFARAALRAAAVAVERRPVSVHTAAELLGVKREVAAHLIRRGLLRTEGGAVGRTELDRFRATYVSCAELARAHGTSPRSLAAKLAAGDMLPVTGPSVDGGRQHFFVREQAEDFIQRMFSDASPVRRTPPPS